MRVRLLVDISGSRNGEPWPQRGEVVDLPDAEAVDMLNAGLAEAVPEVETVEVATAKPVAQKATARRKPAAKRS
jgi:hypothetical protein